MTRELYTARLNIIQGIREFFSNREYLEVHTPLMAEYCIPESTIPLFHTRQYHPWEDGTNLQLLPSPEYYMKQLLASGWGDMFQISGSFRNGETGGSIHLREFTMLEYYAVHTDYMGSMGITQDFIRYLLTLPGTAPPVRERWKNIPFRRISMQEAFLQHAAVDLEGILTPGSQPHPADREALFHICREKDLKPETTDSWEVLFNRIFLNLVEPELCRDPSPVFLYNYPAKLSSLSRLTADGLWNERWELYWQGVELANCFSEENNQENIEAFFRNEIREIELRNREAQQDGGDFNPPTRADREFSRKIAGLPPCSGTAMGVDRLLMILLGKNSIRDVVPFS
ncbi:EF-P lysine aminoacylase GenX [Salinispira pacifica]|uniref:Translation elongation factor P Lys34:lysine transferase n=1 Tax=Salinispira pacifica TaxID=1307761 RepID=V5WM91_9SPIO|nr:translation elongation factor P Lys34--lysine transferase [Salinispira pacifica]AHC16256.1 Translation elongation factor P Lys34:lysine transferase [Salinispira pacifica]